jgi:pimeloyl-ACP methyl ester carboxylesterase
MVSTEMLWAIIAGIVSLCVVVGWYLRKALHQLLRYAVFQPTVTTSLQKSLNKHDQLHHVEPVTKSLDIIDIVTIPLGEVFQNDASPLILYCYGNAGCLAERMEELHHLSKELKLDIVAYDPRGYGNSKANNPNDPLSAHTWLGDGKEVYDWICYHYPQRPIIVWGVSLGGAVAASLAAQPRVQAVVMMTTFARLSDVIAYICLKFFLQRWPMLLETMLAPLAFLVECILPKSYHFPSAQALAAAKKPTLVIHAHHDELMPKATARRLQLASAATTTYKEIAGYHNEHEVHLKFIHEWISYKHYGWKPL